MAATETQIKEDQFTWSSAPDYRAVLHLNRQYLRGEMKTTPYSHRPVDHETRPDDNLPRLHDYCDNRLRLHDYGFLTYGWQSGGHIWPDCTLDRKITDDDLTDNGENPFYELQKRDCLHFLVPQSLFKPNALNAFRLSLIRHPAIVTRIVSKPHEDVLISHNLGAEPYPIVCRRAASTMDGLKDAVYKTHACAPPAPDVQDHSKWNCDAVSRTLPLEFWVATKDWDGQIHVEVLIEDMAVAAGLEMVYAEASSSDVGSAGPRTWKFLGYVFPDN